MGVKVAIDRVRQTVQDLSLRPGARSIALVSIRAEQLSHGGVRVGVHGHRGVVREAEVESEGLRDGSPHTWKVLAWVAGAGPKPSRKGHREWMGAW